MFRSAFRPIQRCFSTTPQLNQPRSLVKLKKLQADYQCEDGRPIHLKGGFSDRVLYYSTLILCVVGIFNVFSVIYDHAKPSSWRGVTC